MRKAGREIKKLFVEPVLQGRGIGAQLLQYAVEKQDVLPIEAKSLLAGIFLDTKSFNVRSGERTFEAAAFLRRSGADRELLDQLQLPKKISQIGTEETLMPVILGATRDIRDKYVLSRLLWDLGISPEEALQK